MKKAAAVSLMLIVIFLGAHYLPMLYEKIFFDDIEKTHLFYSPVSQEFIFKEKVVGPVPKAVREKSEDHHAQIAYRTASGRYLSRVEFEKLLPFIFYKNMDIWGLLPLDLGGRVFDKSTIKKSRRVLELKPGYIAGNTPETRIWPLLESNPGQARLVFPDDRFRMTDTAMVFINADENRVDPGLTRAFTAALTQKGFVFPARSVHGKFTVLKPFDAGVFLVDRHFRVFHVRRVNGKPRVVKTPIDPNLKTRHIQVSESRRKDYYGLLLDQTGNVHLLSFADYHLTPLTLEGYDPDEMDLKLIFNPLYCTAVYSDREKIHAVAMSLVSPVDLVNPAFHTLDSFTHTMSRHSITRAKQVYAVIFPFTFRFDTRDSEFLTLCFTHSGLPGMVGIALCLILCGFRFRAAGVKKNRALPFILVAGTGVYGLIALLLTGMDT